MYLGFTRYWEVVAERYKDINFTRLRAGPCLGKESDYMKDDDSSPLCNQQSFKSKVMYAMYGACNFQWVTLSYVIYLSTVTAPTQQHMAKIDHLLAWCYQERDIVKVINPKDTKISLFADASFGLLPDGGSLGAYIVCMGGCPIYAKGFRVCPLPTSSTEGEYTTLTEAARMAEYCRNFMNEIAIPQQCPTVIQQDNKSANVMHM